MTHTKLLAQANGFSISIVDRSFSSQMDRERKGCHNGKMKRVLKRRSSMENPRQRQKNSLNNRVLNRVRKEFCKILRKGDSPCQNSKDAFLDNDDLTSDDCRNGTSPMYEDGIDGMSSGDDVSDEEENSFFGLKISLDFLQRFSTEDDDREGSAAVHEQVHYEVKMERFRRLSFPFAVDVESEIKQMYAMCMYAEKWVTDKVWVRSSTAQLGWGVDVFGEYMPIVVSGSGGSIEIIRFRKLDDNIVVFGLQENSNSDIYYVSAIEKNPGALVLIKGSHPSSVGTDELESDLRFFRKIYNSLSGGMILKPAFNSDLHLAITQNKLSLVETHSNDFLHWEFV